MKQSENIDHHVNIANHLLKIGKAFKCICKQEHLDSKRKIKLSKGESIKRLCDSCENDSHVQSAKENYCIRIKISEDKTN